MQVHRDLDIVLYGATGHVGLLTARRLARSGSNIRVALAGRSAQRLRVVRDGLGPAAAGWEIVSADLPSAEIDDLAARCAVMVSAVGPYGRHGMPIVAACAAAGTDYVDVTGEVPFVRLSIDGYEEQAAKSGARIVHSCGFDAIPSDLTVYALHRRAAQDGAGDLGETTFVLRRYTGGLSGGSIATMLDLLRASADPDIQRLLDDPYNLSPRRDAEPDLGSQPDALPRRGAAIAPELTGLWAGGYVMGRYNTRCVRRTNALLGWEYGRSFRYSETMITGSSRVSQVMATVSSMAIAGAARFGGSYIQMMPPELVDSAAAATNFDSIADTEAGSYEVQTYTETTTGVRYVATMSQGVDPGYGATAVLLAESALALLCDRQKLPPRSGVLTPVAAMGDVLYDRMATAGVQLAVTRLR